MALNCSWSPWINKPKGVDDDLERISYHQTAGKNKKANRDCKHSIFWCTCNAGNESISMASSALIGGYWSIHDRNHNVHGET